MAGWSMLTNGSTCVEIMETCRKNEYCLDFANSVKECNDECEVKLRCLFDQILSVLLKEVLGESGIWLFPAMLGDGRSIDLFELFCAVRKRGGYELVSKKEVWNFVVEELGFEFEVVASVKLIYFKYLNVLDKWLKGCFRNERSGYGGSKCRGNSGLLSIEMETEFKGLLLNGLDPKEKSDKVAQLVCKKHRKCNDLDVEKSEINLVDTKNVYRTRDNVRRIHSDDEENLNHEGDLMIMKPNIAERESKFRKRKRKSLSGLLNWVLQAAKQPDDPEFVTIPETSKWKEHEGKKELWFQAIRARELLLRRHVYSNAEQCLLQKKLKMQPSMYDDLPAHQSTERLRCSERLPKLAKSQQEFACAPKAESDNSPNKTELDNVHKEDTHVSVDIPATNATPCPFKDMPIEKHIAVGPLFQAKIPRWTGAVSDSDSKFLGTRIWPPQNGQYSSLIETSPIGKGRPDLCSCRFSGSVECSRFHIAEKRMNLKLELGSVFYQWRFDCMGEEVSLRWTYKEEQRFKDIVKSNPPSLGKCFWDDAFKWFPTKTRENLVSYYFNAFLIQRRSYQNRVTPKDIDSDDEESEFGSVSDSFGHAAVRVPGSSGSLICTQNKQCTDLE